MKRSTQLATATIATATTLGLVATPASAATLDQGLYPQNGTINIDPVTTKFLANSPLGKIAGVVEKLVLSTVGYSTTASFLEAAKYVIYGCVRDSAEHPEGRVIFSWQVNDGALSWSCKSYYD